MKHTWNTKQYILIVVLPLVIFPIIVISIYSTINFYNRTFVQNKEFYQGIVSQVTTNIDFYYNQYATYFNDVSKSPIFKNTLGRDVKHFRPLRELLISKMSASIYLLELNYSDKDFNLPYRFSRVTESLIQIDVDTLRNDIVFKVAGKNPDFPMIMGTTKAAKGPSSNRMPIFFYPYEMDENNEPVVMLIAVETANFLNNLYKQNTKLKLGTIYIQDQFGNILDYNHPYIDDYYEYDEKKNRYILNPGDDPNDPYEGMSFAEYRMLNTDSKILSEPQVLEQFKKAEINNHASVEIISYNNRKYLSIATVAPNSKMHVAYFHPINQLFTPIKKAIYIVILLSVITIIAVLFIIFSFSKNFTTPIIELKMRLKKICCAEYDERLEPNNFFGEFINLSTSFNQMIDTISNYRNNMEHLVQKQTEELNKTVIQLTETHEQNKRELEMAQRLQSSLIPKIFPETDLLQFSSKYMPMAALGGDLYDVYQISDSIFSVMILDVCGHGIPAALITTMAKMSFSNNAKKYNTPHEVISNVNLELTTILENSGNFLTAFYAIIDIKAKTISYTNAGHNIMYILHENQTISCMPNNGPVIGVVKDIEFLSCSESLHSGDRIILYTDGLIEARNPTGIMFDTHRLLDTINKHAKDDVSTFVVELCNYLKNFQAQAPITDDIALLVIDTVFH